MPNASVTSDELQIGDQLRQYVFTVIGECVGCREVEIVQNVEGGKLVRVKDSHGGTGFVKTGATAPLKGMGHLTNDESCQIPAGDRRGDHICGSCWFGPPPETT